MAGQITIAPIPDEVTVVAGGAVLGTSRRALELREGSYPPVIYVPREDLDMGPMERTTRSTTCPWKGAASYYSIRTGAGLLENAVWSYEDPKPEVAAIAGHLAFYADKVSVTRG
jgi:uncharacterized protein (DUF427 family)